MIQGIDLRNEPLDSKEKILKAVELLGKSIKRQADPSYYSLERKHLAEGMKGRLITLRACYRAIRDNHCTPLDALNEASLTINNGIESNFLRLIIINIKKQAS